MTIFNQHKLCINAVPPVYRAVTFPRLGDSSIHPQHSAIKKSSNFMNDLILISQNL